MSATSPTLSIDTRALIDAQAGMAATADAKADARAKASDDAAAARATEAERATERRHRERIAHELALQAATASGWNADRANAAIMVAELLPLGLDEAAMVARVRLGLRVLDAVAPDRVPDPLPATPAPPGPSPAPSLGLPLTLTDAQAERYLEVMRAEFKALSIPQTIEKARWHWQEFGRSELAGGKWPAKRPPFTP